MHSNNDKECKMSDIKDDEGIQKIIEEFKGDNEIMINEILI